MLFESLILKCTEKLHEQRTSSAIFHLLKGRRSTQTFQDARLFQLTKFYGIYPSLRRQTFDEKVHTLQNKSAIQITESNMIAILPEGIRLLRQEEKNVALHYFHGLKYFQTDQHFYERILILIQVLTNKKKRHSKYIPIIDDRTTLRWMKHFLSSHTDSIDALLENVFAELHMLLSQLPEVEAEMFVDRLAGFKTYGLSEQQLARKYELPLIDIPLYFIAIIHQLLKLILENTSMYPFFYQLISDLSTSGFITKSANETFRLWSQGYSIEKIIAVRNLKESTIQDHFVEIALYHPPFRIDEFVDDIKQQQILDVISNTKDMKLKSIKDKVSSDISYFQIRLIIASKVQ